MAEVYAVLVQYLRNSQNANLREEICSEISQLSLEDAWTRVGNNLNSAEVIAELIAKLWIDQRDIEGATEAAKTCIQRASRDEEGIPVALLVGEFFWRGLNQIEVAEPYFRRVRRSDPAQPLMLDFYRELLSGQTEVSQLMQVLSQARKTASSEELQYQLAEELSDLARNRMGNVERAVELWRSVLRERPQDPRAAGHLQQLYRETKRWPALVELLKESFDRIEAVDETREERIQKLWEIAAVYRDEVKLDSMYLNTMQRVLEIDPFHEECLSLVAENHVRAKRWTDLLAINAKLLEKARNESNVPTQIEMLRNIAKTWRGNLGNPQRAIEPLQELLQLEPADADALSELAEIHEKRRDWRSLIALKRHQLSNLSDEEGLSARIALAQLSEEKLGDRREAISDWNAVLEFHGEVKAAFEGLLRLYGREGRWAEYTEILHRCVEACETQEEKIDHFIELAQTYSERLHNTDAAIGIWRKLIELVPGHDKATRMLRDAFVSRRDWQELTHLYESQERIADLVDVLQSAADRVVDVDERVNLYRQVAELSRTKLGLPERATKALERTLALQPDNMIVANELVPIYRDQANWARLMSTYEVLLAGTSDVAEKLEIIEQLRKVSAEQIKSSALAFQWATRAYRIRPQDSTLRDSLEQSAEENDSWDELTAVFEERLVEDELEPEERLALLRKLAHIAQNRLYKPDDAQRFLRRIIDIDAKDDQALSSLESIYASTRRWEDLCEVYRIRLSVMQETSDKIAMLRSIAALEEDHLHDLGRAIATHKEVLEIQPDDTSVLAAMSKIYRVRGEWEELADVLQKRRDLAPSGTGQIPILLELSQVRATRLRETELAIAGFLRVLHLDPRNRDAVSTLEELRMGDPSSSLVIMRGLLPYYRLVEDFEKQSEAMEILIAVEEDPQELWRQRQQLAELYESMDSRQEDALRLHLELFRQQPHTWETRQSMRRVAIATQQVDSVAEAYEEVLSDASFRSPAIGTESATEARAWQGLRRDLLLELATIYQSSLNQPERSERCYREVLEQEETHQAAYEAYEVLLRNRGADAELLQLYQRRLDVVFHQREQRHLLTRIIELARDRLNEPEIALRHAEELLDIIPEDLPTIEMLVRMYREITDKTSLIRLEELLTRWAELIDGAQERHAIMCERARLRMGSLPDAQGAVDLLGLVLSEAPDHRPAQALLEELLNHAEVQLAVAGLLEPIYLRREEHDKRVALLKMRRNQIVENGSRDELVTLLLEIASIEEEQLGQVEEAFSGLSEAFLLDPQRPEVSAAFERVGSLLDKKSSLVDGWGQVLKDHENLDRGVRIEFQRKVAEMYDAGLHDSERAQAAFREVLALDPPDVEISRRALRALVRLDRELEDHKSLVLSLRSLIRLAETSEEQIGLRFELSKHQLEELEDWSASVSSLQEILNLDPHHQPATEMLEKIFLDQRQWRSLSDILQQRINLSSDARVQSGLWRRVGSIRREHLGDRHGAIGAFQALVNLKIAKDESAYGLQQLAQLYGELERWPDLEDVLRRMISLADRNEDRSDYLRQCAEIVGTKLGRPRDALELLKRALELVPQDTRSRARVRDCLEQEDVRDVAIKILTPLYEAEQNWRSLLELQELQARNQPSGRRRLQALMLVASTLEKKLEDTDRAFSVMCDAMVESGDQPELGEIIDSVERLGQDPERSQQLFEAYERTVDRILDSDLQQHVLRKLGEVAFSRLGRLDAARSAYERVLELTPEDNSTSEALELIYQRQDDPQALAQLLMRNAERSTHTKTRDRDLIRAAEIYRTQLEDAETAIRLYERLSTVGLHREDVQSVLEPLYEQTGRYRELATHLNRKLTHLSGAELAENHIRLGRLYGEKLDDPEEGIRHLGTALRIDPNHAVGISELDRYLEDRSMRSRAADMLEPIFVSVGDWQRLVKIHEIRLNETGDNEARVRILLKMAQLQEEQLEDLDGAFEEYSRVFEERSDDRYVRDQLLRLAGVLGKMDRYATLLTEHIERNENDSRENYVSIVREAANLWFRVLKQADKAVPLFQRLHTLCPEDEDVFSSLEAAFTAAGLWQELVHAYWQECESSSDAARQVRFLMKLATVALDALGQTDEATKAYYRILEIDPSHDDARTRLEGLLEQGGKHNELIDLLRQRSLRIGSHQDRVPVMLRIAQMQEGALEDPDAAIDTISEALDESAGDDRLIKALEAIVGSCPDARPRIFAILQPIYQQNGDTHRLISVVEWQLSVIEDPERRHDLFFELAQLLGKLGSDGQKLAFRALAQALTESGPSHSRATLDNMIEEVANELQAPVALAHALIAASSSPTLIEEPDRRIQLLMWAARLHLHDAPDAAVDALKPVMKLKQDDDEVLDLMDQALGRLGFHEELVGILEKRIDIVFDDDKHIELLRRVARLREDVLLQVKRAEQDWKRLLELLPTDPEALQRLSQTYADSGSTDDLVEVLNRRIDSTSDITERRGLRIQLANLQREALKDRQAEISVLRSLLGECPDDEAALAALSRALLACEQFSEAAEVMQQRSMNAASEEQRAGLLLEAARIFVGSLNDPIGALDRYEQVFEHVPGYDDAVSDLVMLCRRREVAGEAAKLVRSFLSQQGRHPELAKLLSARADLSDDPQEVNASLAELAELYEYKLQDIQNAYSATLRRIEHVEANDFPQVLEDAMRRAKRVGSMEELVSILTEFAHDQGRELASRNLAAISASDTVLELSNDREQALSILGPLLDCELPDIRICEKIESVARSLGRNDMVAKALQEAYRIGGGGEAMDKLLVRLGDTRQELNEVDLAIDCYREALSVNPEFDLAVEGLERLLDHSFEQAPQQILDLLNEIYETRCDRQGQAKISKIRLHNAYEYDKPLLLKTLATQLDDGGGEAHEALDVWGQLLALVPDSEQALERVLSLAGVDNLGVRAGRILLDAVDLAAKNGVLCVPLALASARLWLEDLGEPSKSREPIRLILEEYPAQKDAIVLSIEIARGSGDPEQVHSALLEAFRAPIDDSERSAYLREAAEMADRVLKQPELAVADLRQLIELEPEEHQSWQRLFVLLGTAQDYETLVDLLAQRIMITQDLDERRELRYRLANLYTERLNRPESAIEVYGDMIGQDPENLTVIREFEVLLRRIERWPELRDLMLRKLDVVEKEERLDVFIAMAKIEQERLGQPNQAIAILTQACQEFPEQTKTHARLESLLRAGERWDALADLMRNKLAWLKDSGEVSMCRRASVQLADLLTEKLRDYTGSEQILESLLEQEPDEIHVMLALVKLKEAMGDPQGAQSILERAIKLEPTGEAGADLYYRLARGAKDGDERRNYLEQAISRFAEHIPSRTDLLQIYRDEERWSDLVVLLEKEESSEVDKEKCTRLQFERVDIMMNKLNDIDGALRALATLYEQVQDDVEINSRIADALFTAGRIQEADGMYGWLLEISNQGRRTKKRAHYLTRLAQIDISRGEIEPALERLQEAYRIDTTNVETLMVLGTLHEQKYHWQDALKIYRAMLLQNADRTGLLRRGDIYLRLSAVHLGLDEQPKARAMLKRGIEEDPEHNQLVETLRHLEAST